MIASAISLLDLANLSIKEPASLHTLPAELKLCILFQSRVTPLPDPPIWSNAGRVATRQVANNELLMTMSLFHSSWTKLAQSELFDKIMLSNRRRAQLLIELLRGREEFRVYALKAIRISLAGFESNEADLQDAMDVLAEYCPRVVEICCSGSNVQLSNFCELSIIGLPSLRSDSRKLLRRWIPSLEDPPLVPWSNPSSNSRRIVHAPHHRINTLCLWRL